MRLTAQSGNQEVTFCTYPLSHFPLFFCCEFPHTETGVHITVSLTLQLLESCCSIVDRTEVRFTVVF